MAFDGAGLPSTLSMIPLSSRLMPLAGKNKMTLDKVGEGGGWRMGSLWSVSYREYT